MRTTVRLDDHLLRKAKQHAVREGTTLTAVLREALLAYLSRPASGALATPPRLPVSGHGGTLPGVDLDDTSTQYDAMDGRR